MSKLKRRITENGIDYILVGDYYIPDLKLPEEHRPIGKYGRMHREYLREVHPARLNTLILTGELWTYLADLNEQAQERLDTIMEQMKTAEGVTEELKRTHQMEWVQRCNNIHNRAEEIVVLLNPGMLENADLDLRYRIPDRIEEVSNSLIQSNGYDYIDTEDGDPGPLMGIWLETENAHRNWHIVRDLFQREKFIGNDLSLSAQIYISEKDTDDLENCVLVFPE